MKKQLLLSIMLMGALVVQAQMKTVTPKMQKGLEKVYATTITTTMPGQKAVNTSTEHKYCVADATAEGYQIDVEMTQYSSDAAPTDITSQLIGNSLEMLKGLRIRIATDKQGRTQRIVNYNELKPQLDKICNKVAEKLYQALPELKQMMPTETLKDQLMQNVTEESMLRSFQEATNPLALSGKQVATGAQEEFVNSQGLKMKRMYFVSGNSIIAKSSMNMTKDELKALIIAQVEKLMPDQADMVKKNIDQLTASGMLKMEMEETANYELQEDNWAKTIKADSNMQSMGQSVKSHTEVTAK